MNNIILQDSLETWLTRMAATTIDVTNYKSVLRYIMLCAQSAEYREGLYELRNLNIKQLY